MTHEPLLITAHLAAGFACTSPWGIAIDGILAAHLWAEMKRDLVAAGSYVERALHASDPPDVELPLMRCNPNSPEWHWAATYSLPAPNSISTTHMWTGRIDARELEINAKSLPRNVSQRQGRYRTRYMPLLVTLTPYVQWHVVGDAAAIKEILSEVGSIGKKRTSGEGHVLRWDITPSDVDTTYAAHRHPNGELGRPTPPECFDLLDVAPAELGEMGIRPPSMHPSRRRNVYLPGTIA